MVKTSSDVSQKCCEKATPKKIIFKAYLNYEGVHLIALNELQEQLTALKDVSVFLHTLRKEHVIMI